MSPTRALQSSLLHRAIPILVTLRAEISLRRIVSDVPSQIVKLFYGANQMVERFALPKMPFVFQSSIDLCRRELEPVLTLFGTRAALTKLCNQMDMVWHDRGTIEIIAIAIEVTEGVQYGLREFRSLQKGVTGVPPVLFWREMKLV